MHYFVMFTLIHLRIIPQPAIACSKLTIETLKQRCDICSKLTIKIPELRHRRRSGIIIVNFEHISQLVLVFLLLNLTLNM